VRFKTKDEVRRYIWSLMEKSGVSLPPHPCWGRIPNFRGAWDAANRLLEALQPNSLRPVLVSPDSPQRPVRLLLLRRGIPIIMPTPRLRRGYVYIDPQDIGGKYIRYASTLKGGLSLGRPIKELPHINIVIEGCVAVDRLGNRIGKGGGYGDREIKEARKLNPSVIVAVTCHSSQVLDRVPTDQWDEPINIISTERFLISLGVETEGNTQRGV